MPPVVDVIVDDARRLGALSYRVPDGLDVGPGDAVHVPFGNREAYGIVLGTGDPARATRDVIATFGRRADPADLAVVDLLAARHLADRVTVARRLSPRAGRGDEPLDAGPVALEGPVTVPVTTRDEPGGRYLLRAPLADPGRLAAEAATRLAAAGGQVLVLCPTSALVAGVVGHFTSGVARLDTQAPAGAWAGFVAGTVGVGVGTRSAALYSPARLAGLVVVEEDHPGHVESTQPHTHARDVAALRARLRGVPLVLTGSAPTAAGLGAGVKTVIAGSRRDHWPRVRVCDRNEFPPYQRAVPPTMVAAATRTLAAGGRVVVIGERGTARRVCVTCRAPRPCECGDLGCRHDAGPCDRCGSDATRVAGWDADRLAAALGDGVRPVSRLDAAKARTRADMVVVGGVDRELSRPGLTPVAASWRLVTTAASVCRPGGELWIPTGDPTHPVLAAAERHDTTVAAKAVFDEARAAGLPPFGCLVEVKARRRAEPDVSRWPGMVFGPRSTGAGEWEILVQCDAGDLAALARPIELLRRTAKVRLTVAAPLPAAL